MLWQKSTVQGLRLPEPDMLEDLQAPRTASSGRRLMAISFGGTYLFLVFSTDSRCSLISFVLPGGRSETASTTRREDIRLVQNRKERPVFRTGSDMYLAICNPSGRCFDYVVEIASLAKLAIAMSGNLKA